MVLGVWERDQCGLGLEVSMVGRLGMVQNY